MTVRVVLADDQPLVRTALQMVITDAPDLEVVEEAGTDLRGTDLSGVDLTGADLRGVVADETTTWPDGFNPWAAVIRA